MVSTQETEFKSSSGVGSWKYYILKLDEASKMKLLRS